ncbi:hypothetical protein C7974DRAFT_409825 [Boeremia exigua]|uniref:uncharacterized protein n=1 Tax=Boeremia exigua TaxID=749465 RepID=UPI001E8CDC09|nr:uncharacterized protein C7974DRAFT_409825 [Boeremia exigua]KAH6638821.1 hypothetical protein C7974DRAFT_409825 [Boeremia exigua]
MNTVKSVYYGWATLIAAGGGAYYFAKKSINAERAAKAEADRQKRVRQYQLEAAHGMHGQSPSNGASSNPTVGPNAVVSASTSTAQYKGDKQGVAQSIRSEDESGSASVQASRDPAATRHAPASEGAEKSKYEASDVYRTRKGDRFS